MVLGRLGDILARLGPSWAVFVGVFGRLVGILGACQAALGRHGASWEHLGGVLCGLGCLVSVITYMYFSALIYAFVVLQVFLYIFGAPGPQSGGLAPPKGGPKNPENLD